MPSHIPHPQPDGPRTQTEWRLIRSLAWLDGHTHAAVHSPADAWHAVSNALPLLRSAHRSCPITEREVGVMLRGADGRYVIWVTDQPNCLAAELVNSGVRCVGLVHPDLWRPPIPNDLSTLRAADGHTE